MDELNENSGYNRRLTSCTGSHVIADSISATWNDDFHLTNLSFKVSPRELCAIVGPVGCGKTSILMTLLGELPVSAGSLRCASLLAIIIMFSIINKSLQISSMHV